MVEDDQVLKLQVKTRQVQVQVDNLATLRLAGYRGWQASCCQLPSAVAELAHTR